MLNYQLFETLHFSHIFNIFSLYLMLYYLLHKNILFYLICTWWIYHLMFCFYRIIPTFILLAFIYFKTFHAICNIFWPSNPSSKRKLNGYNKSYLNNSNIHSPLTMMLWDRYNWQNNFKEVRFSRLHSLVVEQEFKLRYIYSNHIVRSFRCTSLSFTHDLMGSNWGNLYQTPCHTAGEY